MAGVSVDSGGKGGKKPIDSEINMIPFIDLLVCCISFLIITAMWTHLEQLNLAQPAPSSASPPDPFEQQRTRVMLRINQNGYSLGDTEGQWTVIPKVGPKYDTLKLKTELERVKRQDPSRRDLIVSPEDGIAYEDIVAAMDMALRDSDADRDSEPDFPEISVSGSSGGT